jgi:hypothetical protein
MHALSSVVSRFQLIIIIIIIIIIIVAIRSRFGFELASLARFGLLCVDQNETFKDPR